MKAATGTTPCMVKDQSRMACTIARSRRKRAALTDRRSSSATMSMISSPSFIITYVYVLTKAYQYSKFIDSHLKPFRCKIEACAKQEFSSTACLLRHEREAHGMHGHGDRPHLCFYPGCERGFAGNGFPRRYNLYDHMRRVHDHKEDTHSGLASPSIGESLGSKKPSGRKRKATASSLPEPAAQRPRITSQQPASFGYTPAMPLPRQDYQAPLSQGMQVPAQVSPVQPVHYPNQVPFMSQPVQVQPRDDHRQRLIYSQWTSQRELLARQLDFVQSPEDEAGMERFTQDLQELRRLSEEMRRG